MRFPSELFDKAWELLRPSAEQPIPEEQLCSLAGIAKTLDDKLVIQAFSWDATWLARTEGAAGPRTLVKATTRPPSPILEVKAGDHYHTVLIEKHILTERDEQEQEDDDVKMDESFFDEPVDPAAQRVAGPVDQTEAGRAAAAEKTIAAAKEAVATATANATACGEATAAANRATERVTAEAQLQGENGCR